MSCVQDLLFLRVAALCEAGGAEYARRRAAVSNSARCFRWNADAQLGVIAEVIGFRAERLRAVSAIQY